MSKLLKVGIALMSISGMVQAAFVTIGDAGNAADPNNSYGTVSYKYKISDKEVTIGEFAASGAGDGDENYWNDGVRNVGNGAPAVNVSLYEAMRYCNWLTSGNIDDGVYIFSGGSYQSADRNAAITTYGTVYALPTYHEWYKAAYYTGDAADYWSLYANGTDTIPTWVSGNGWNYYNGSPGGSLNSTWESGYGAQEQNGTYDMMGNVSEWVENSSIHGGSFNTLEYYLRSSTSTGDFPTSEYNDLGFRVVAVPEPSTVLLFGIGGVGAWLLRRNKMKAQREDV